MRIFLSILMILAATVSTGADNAPPYRTLSWEDLMPTGEWERVNKEMEFFFNTQGNDMFAEGSAFDEARQFGTYNVVEELNNQKIRLAGFVVPFDFSSDKEVSEFLLVPYFGACLHTPPPPPNQIVFVKAAKPIKVESIWDPIWAYGNLMTEKHLNEMGNAAYTLQLEKWDLY